MDLHFFVDWITSVVLFSTVMSLQPVMICGYDRKHK